MQAPCFWDASVGYWEISLGQSLAKLSDWLLEAQPSFKWTSSVSVRHIPAKEGVWQVKCFYFMMENEQEHQTGKSACQAWEFLTDRLTTSPACSRGSSIHSTEKQLFKLLFADFSLLIIIAICRFRRAKGRMGCDSSWPKQKWRKLEEVNKSVQVVRIKNNLRQRSRTNTDVYQNLVIEITKYQFEYVRDWLLLTCSSNASIFIFWNL